MEFSRQALHAQALTLEHPGPSAARMTWTAPLPEDLRRASRRRFSAGQGVSRVTRASYPALRSPRAERESILYGELRAQAARHEAIARAALARLEASEARERKHLRDLGTARAELAAAIGQLHARPAAPKVPRDRSPLRLKAKAKAQGSKAARNRRGPAPPATIKHRTRKLAAARNLKPRPVPGRKKAARVGAAKLRSRR